MVCCVGKFSEVTVLDVVLSDVIGVAVVVPGEILVSVPEVELAM